MNPIKKNILVNAAMSCNQDCNKTLAMVSGHLTKTELLSVKITLESGVKINHNTIEQGICNVEHRS